MTMAFDLFTAWLGHFEHFVLWYFLALNSIYLLLTALASVDFAHYFRRVPFSGHDDIFANPLTPGVSVIVPAFNEEIGIVDNVRAMLSLRYPEFEVVVVDDGSSDSTFSRLQAEFDLFEVPTPSNPDALSLAGQITSVHLDRSGASLTVVRKVNAGSRADAINAGINCARLPLVCMVDADSLLDAEALLRVVKPFVDDPQHVVASGGVVRPANGCVVKQGAIVRTGMPRNWLGRIQVVEYLRSFLLGRTGWSSLGALLIISGAFGMFRRDLVLEVGGLDRDTMGEDAELVARLHHHLRGRGIRDYRVVFVAEPVCWTEVPVTRQVLGRQRRRWSRGLAEVLWKHRGMMCNPRYGRIGMVVLPYYLLFELLGPIVELLGVCTMAGVVAVGLLGDVIGRDLWLLNTSYAVAFAVVAIGYGMLLSVAALVVEEFSFYRMSSWRDLLVSLAASVVENLGFRQLHTVWRLRGLWWWLTRGQASWGVMTRAGYAHEAEVKLDEGRLLGATARDADRVASA